MKSCEQYIDTSSDYYNYTPSLDAQKTFLYPICTGHFIYEAGYHQLRNSFNSFLLMYVLQGELEVRTEDHSEIVGANHFIALDCYRLHGYRTSKGWEALWFHFDGPVARSYYEMIVARHGNFFSIKDPYPVLTNMRNIYQTFADGKVIYEAILSKQITDILTSLLLCAPQQSNASAALPMEEITSYINEHFTENLSIHTLAARAMVSPYHFIRVFKKMTGFTPHEYLINTRISNAKYLLKTSRMNVKAICFQSGFSCESVFCTSFKKRVGMTPAEYRNAETTDFVQF